MSNNRARFASLLQQLIDELGESDPATAQFLQWFTDLKKSGKYLSNQVEIIAEGEYSIECRFITNVSELLGIYLHLYCAWGFEELPITSIPIGGYFHRGKIDGHTPYHTGKWLASVLDPEATHLTEILQDRLSRKLLETAGSLIVTSGISCFKD